MKRLLLYIPLLLLPICLLTATTAQAEKNKRNISLLQSHGTIRITTKGEIFVGERQTNLKRMAKELRKQGIKRDETIRVTVPPNVPKRALVAISRELVSKGYTKVLFAKPPKAIAETEDP